MSKINTIRLINVNYNNNAIRVSDEIFRLNGESTLLSLRNGGGKSVLVQMFTAPFVHKRYRDAKDRPFESYFTTSKPAFILVEWKLDKGAGYVLTGMMVRRNQEVSETNSDSLEMVNFISEYSQPCITDINSISVVEKGKKEIILKSFSACRQMFEGYKKDHSQKFFCYDMANPSQSRQYFDKLAEYQINYKEWENIIKKVNLKESGLSELFSDCKDEKGLVDKWFLDAVENKLNKDKSRITQFQSIISKYVGLYKDNRAKIARRDTIQLFKEEGNRIRERAEIYKAADEEKSAHESRIADFIIKLVELRERADIKCKNICDDIEAVKKEYAHVEYEKLSNEIYGLRDRQKYHISNKEMIEIERDEIYKEAEKTEHKIHLLECAKHQKSADDDLAELNEIKQKLFVSRQNDADLEPERKSLGYFLKCHYEKELADNAGQQAENSRKHNVINDGIAADKSRLSELEESINKQASKKGGLIAKVGMYDEREDYFNKHYNEKLIRNILGEYEPGILDIKKESYEKELSEEVRNRNNLVKQREKNKEELKRLKRNLDDLRREHDRIEYNRDRQEEVQNNYEDELNARKIILQYLNLGNEVLLDEEKILKVSESKLKELAGYRRNLEKEEDALKKELSKLTRGKILELPEELEQELDNMGIHIVYGMEWLKKNGCSEDRNLELVRNNPFLPYSLILSGRELDRLSQNAGNVYTSFPIPIVNRENLENGLSEEKQGVVRFKGISFYVLFNENLLNETKLAELVEEKEQQIADKRDAISIRDNEYKEYFGRQEVIKNQKVNRESYDLNKELLKELKSGLDKIENDLQKSVNLLSETEEEGSKLQEDIGSLDKKIESIERRNEEFVHLCSEYEQFRQNKIELEKCKKEQERLIQQKKLIKERIDKQAEEIRSLEAEKDGLIHLEDKFKDSLRRYSEYCETAGAEEKAYSVEEAEARFNAITSAVSQEIKSLMEQEQKADKRYKESYNELMHLCGKYNLEQGSWKDIIYSRKEETGQEIILEDRKKKLEVKNRLWNDEDKMIAVISSNIDNCMSRMINECNEKVPLPREEIQNKDFDAVKNHLEYQKGELVKNLEEQQEYLKSYDENLTALAEYDLFTVKEPVDWEEDFANMKADRLRKVKGMLIRDYGRYKDNVREAKDKLLDVLHSMLIKEEFKDDYYRKPLESMIGLKDDAMQVLKQLNTTIQSYEELIEKLEVDISMVEKEKEKIVELLEDYIKEVHNNLGKIDSNSTITIRDRQLKMLKIELPEWEINENLYHIRLQDMVDEITQKGIQIFDRNENAQEYFGTQITTKNIYDTIVGIGNVQVKLYKIEEQREYPITWAEVARNSGGEGFLSAFVILSSLLYYMRKDDTDIFADKNEGKVLLMDNPFAQTNASHLLKPLMDMADKTNTQLICLTGLGGESIYNRFNNIYVINLIAASLRNGMQYLRVNHVKGNEPETLLLSQIEVLPQVKILPQAEVMEQQELKLF